MRDLFGQEHSRDYSDYLRSSEWKKKRKAAVKQAHGICQRCGRTEYSRRIEVHHRTYERLGRELPEDLEVICVECHRYADAERAEETENRRLDNLWEARLDGWATKVYGEDWCAWPGATAAENAFRDWLEDHQ